jgi:hypothetical protein
METVLILGNGFDKHCGLASSYNDFFKFEEEHNDEVKKFSEEIKKIKPDYEKGVDIINNAFIDACPTFSKDFTVWDSMFLLLNYLGGFNQDPRWCDVESEMKITLGMQNFTRSTFSWGYVLTYINWLITFRESLWDSSDKLSTFLYNHPNLSRNGIEMIVAKQIVKSKGLGKATSFTYDELENYLSSQQIQFEQRFCSYIKEISQNNPDYEN